MLSDPEQRTRYDLRYEEGRALQWGLAREAADGEVIEDDRSCASACSHCSTCSAAATSDPAMGNIELERLLSLPPAHLDFHVWFLKEKKLVERTERASRSPRWASRRRRRRGATSRASGSSPSGLEPSAARAEAPLRKHLSTVTPKRGLGSAS